MRIGCCAYSYREYLQSGKMSLEDFVKTCYEMGLDGVELTSYYFPSTDDKYLKDLKKLVFSYGLHISGTAVGSNFCQADESKRVEHEKMTMDWIDHSVILGAPCIRVFAGPVPEGQTEEEAFGWAVQSLKRCVEYGRKKGVVVALENHGGITSTAHQVLEIVEAVKDDWFGINLDFGNYRTPYEEYQMTAPYTVTTHAKTHYSGRSGAVEVDYGKVSQIMQKAGYKGYISIEYEGTEDPITAVPRFVGYLKRSFVDQ